VPKVLVDKEGNILRDYVGGWGYEARSLFQAEDGWDLVGADASGLELRCLAHYMYPWDNGKYAEAVINGKQENKTDIHSMNQKAANLGTRNQAKTFIYAFLGQPATRGTKTL
jgi:DNA polymerase I-like protein with 3'-5' exonuclease and polymerase domains